MESVSLKAALCDQAAFNVNLIYSGTILTRLLMFFIFICYITVGSFYWLHLDISIIYLKLHFRFISIWWYLLSPCFIKSGCHGPRFLSASSSPVPLSQHTPPPPNLGQLLCNFILSCCNQSSLLYFALKLAP